MTIGRSLPYLGISMLLLLLGIKVVFHIFTIPQRGDTMEVFVFLIPVVLAITFLGMVLMNIFKNREDTIMLCTVFSIPAVMMGGVSYPIVAFPLWIKVLGFFFPSTIGVKGFLALSQAGASLYEIRDIYIQMWGICIFYFVLAVWTNRRFLYMPEAAQSLSNESAIVTAIAKFQVVTQDIIRQLLTPFKTIIWRFDNTLGTVDTTLTDKLKNISADNLQTPAAYIVGPTMDALKYVDQYDDLKNLYANLLANAMDKQYSNAILPSYIDIIKSLSPDEAVLLTIFIGSETIPYVNIIQKANKETKAFSVVLENHTCLIQEFNIAIAQPDNMPLYFSNFVRLGLLTSPEGFSLERERYNALENCDRLQQLKKDIEQMGYVYETQRRFYKLTLFGKQFVKMVVQNKA